MVLVGGIFAKTSIALNAGSISSIFFYDQNGVLVNNITSSYISVNDTLVIKSTNNKAVFTYKYGNIVLDKESILVIKEKNLNFTFYLVDGTAEISSKSTSFGKVSVITPVTSYTFNGAGNINVISTDEKESFELYSGTTTVYNSITGKTYSVHENNKMELNTPKVIALNELDKQNSRETFVNTTFPFGINAITKSDDNVDQYILNILATGNGQGNVNLLNFATFKGILDEADKKNNKYLLIDAGNTLSGSVYVNQDKGETASRILEKVGYDVFVPGSYDFAYGYKQLQKLDKESNVTFLSSNVLTSEDYNILTPYQLYAFNDLRIAVVGLSNPSELTKLDNLKFNSNIIVDNAQAAIDIAKQYVDLVILVTNYSDDYINSRIIAKNIKGIDLIIDGSRSIAGTAKEGGTYIISTGVGYNKIIDTQISVFKNHIITINPVIVHSSNIAIDTNNQLASSLGVYNYENNKDMIDLLTNISVKDGLSTYLISPDVATMSVNTNTNVPSTPVFSKYIVRKTKPEIAQIEETDNIKAVSTKIITNNMDESSLVDHQKQTVIQEKTNAFGIKASVETNAIVEDFNFKDYEILATASIVPYFKSKNLTLALHFDVTVDDLFDESNRDISYSIPELPDSNLKSIYQYSIRFVDELSFNFANNKVNFELKKQTFNSPIKTPLVYRKLGSDNLTAYANIELGPLNTEMFLSDPTLDAYYNTSGYQEQAGWVETLTLMDNNLVIQAAGIARGQHGIVNTFPIVSTTYTFLNKPNYNLGLNVNGATIVKLRPSFNYDLISDNYLVGSSLILNSGITTLEAGVNYLATEDANIFNVNLLHQQFNRSNLFANFDNNTLVPYMSIDSRSKAIKAHLGYSLPINLTNNLLKEDLVDFSFDYESEKFSMGMFYIQSDLMSDIENVSSLKDFFYSDKVEYGIKASWNINDRLSSAMKAGVTSAIANPLYLNLNFTLNLDKEF
jgi:hypothetical protein